MFVLLRKATYWGIFAKVIVYIVSSTYKGILQTQILESIYLSNLGFCVW